MKKIYLFAALLTGVTVFTACSKDDNNDGGEKAPRIVRIIESYGTSDEIHDTTSFGYDTKGRLMVINDVTIEYPAANKIIVTEPDEDNYTSIHNIDLKDGRTTHIVNSYVNDKTKTEELRDTCIFTYTGGFLTKVTTNTYNVVDGTLHFSESALITFTISGTNLTNNEYVNNTHPDESKSTTFAYSATPNNNTNPDIFSFIWNLGEEQYPSILGVAGKRNKSMPTQSINFEGGQKNETIDYSYDTKDGVITKITTKIGDKTNGKYEIFYQ